MASSSGNSSGSTQIQNISGSDGGLVDQRKRKRMQSNRESARRSRMRKQKHLDDLMGQVSQLRKENDQITTNTNITTQHFLNIEAENSVLRAQMAELSHRLQSLNDIINYITTNNNNNNNNNNNSNCGVFGIEDVVLTSNPNPENIINDPWSMMYMNQQPIMASADYMFQY